MDPYFKDYKEQEGRKVVTILHASTAVATAVLYKLGADANSAFFVLSLIGNAAAYGYWYLADASVYHESAAIHAISQGNHAQEFLRELLAKLSEHQQHCQLRCFMVGVFSWAALLTGLTAAFVLDIGLMPGWIGAFFICVIIFAAARDLLSNLRKHMEIMKAERAEFLK